MPIVVITPPATEPISLDEARAQVGVDGSAHDTLLTLYIATARQWCEDIIGRRLITQTVEQRLDAFPAGKIALDGVPAQAITSVKYDDPAGTEQTLAPEAYSLDAAAYPGGWLLPAAGTVWPATAARTNAVRIRYTVGYGNAAAVPAPLRAWMLLQIAALFEQRAAQRGGSALVENAMSPRLLDAWRVL